MARAKRLVFDQDSRSIARGAFLHDIGKMAIPDAILRKTRVRSDPKKSDSCAACYHGYQT